jgi:hypothetical protein
MCARMDDRNFKLAMAGAATALAAVIVFLRFCGDLSLPPKPPPPTVTIAGANDILTASSATPAAWQAFLEKDAAQAGVAVPTVAVMSRALPHRGEDKRRTLTPGDPPIDVAGLRLTLEVGGADGEPPDLILGIENLGDVDVAYQVVTRPSGNAAACHSRDVLPYDANVLLARRRERRSECSYRDGMVLNIDRVETVELPPLAAWYVSRLPAAAMALDTRLTAGHRPLSKAPLCNTMMSQVIRSGLESGRIEWRDLVDFFARHRCDTYQFPKEYKAFRKDNERSLPVVSFDP